MRRRQLKAQAKMLVVTSKPRPLVTSLIYVLATMLISVLLIQIVLVYQPSESTFDDLSRSINALIRNSNVTDPDQLTEIIANSPTVQANFDKIFSGFDAYLDSPIAMFLNLALIFVSCMLSVGMKLFALNTTTRTAVYSDLLGGFSFFFRLLGYVFLISIFIFLWSLLLIIPGIIAAYRYRMAFYLVIEHPECSVYECIRRSSRMMKGNKWELFVMDLSFIGWEILISASGMLGYAVQVWYLPYYEITNVLYYRHLNAGLQPGETFNV